MDVIAIAAGPHHVVAVGSESEVFSWGRGEAGRLGLGNEEDWCVSLSVYRFYFISEHITEVSSCVLCVSGVFFFFFFCTDTKSFPQANCSNNLCGSPCLHLVLLMW